MLTRRRSTDAREPPAIATRRALACALGLGLALSAAGGCEEEPPRELLVFAAASLGDVLPELATRFERSEGISVRMNLAGSNVLALQIEASGRGDLYLSADERWMDHLQQRGAITPSTRRAFLSNRLVIIANRASALELARPDDLATARFRVLSLASPDAVPAGRYARAYLESVPLDGGTLWDRLADRVAPAPDVRAALAMVEADPDIVGIVYRTDATRSDVRILHEVAEHAGPPIRYVGAVIEGASDPAAAARFLAYLSSPDARPIFEAHGFIVTPTDLE